MSESSGEIRRLMRPALVLVLLGSCVGLYVYGGMPPLLLFLAASALSLTIFFLWNSLQQVDEKEEMDFEEALSLAAPSATEEQKRAILRTLKDLEYELSVGKISQEDFDEVSAQYRAEAKRLIYLADEEMKARMKHAEQLVQKRLKRTEKDRKAAKKAQREELDPASEAQASATDSEHSSSAGTEEETTSSEAGSPVEKTPTEQHDLPLQDEPSQDTSDEPIGDSRRQASGGKS